MDYSGLKPSKSINSQEMSHTHVYRLFWSRQFYNWDSLFPGNSGWQVDNLTVIVTDLVCWLVFTVNLIKCRMTQEIGEAHLWIFLWGYFQRRLTYGYIYLECELDNPMDLCLGKNKIYKKTTYLNAYMFFLFSILYKVPGTKPSETKRQILLLFVSIKHYDHSG